MMRRLAADYGRAFTGWATAFHPPALAAGGGMSDARTTKVVPDVSVVHSAFVVAMPWVTPRAVAVTPEQLRACADCGSRLKAAIAQTITAATRNLFIALSSATRIRERDLDEILTTRY